MTVIDDEIALKKWQTLSNHYYARMKFVEENSFSSKFLENIIPDPVPEVNSAIAGKPGLPVEIIQKLKTYASNLSDTHYQRHKYTIFSKLVFQENAEFEAFKEYERSYLATGNENDMRSSDYMYASVEILSEWFSQGAPAKYLGSMRALWMRIMWYEQTHMLRDYANLIPTQFLFFTYFDNHQAREPLFQYLKENQTKKVELAKMLLRVIGYSDELDTMAGSWVVEIAHNEGYFLG